ncbi:hypothetical protein PIROE2DRAFT_18162 [Piromyces sp. E2]|nr:hypothetical protein PIROE2DRAFT_18162 [Piromyces sp. E2]|eukprot:OUM56994.1 hypothetical protein PIROE2DRAFT_18162 [Piromyces sp. E2]
MNLKLNEVLPKLLYALITVIITVHAFVFYSVYVINGESMKQQYKVEFVLDAVNKQGGIYMFGTYLPIWAVILIEIGVAYVLEILVAGPLAFKLASNAFDPMTTPKPIFTSAIICSTVSIMCPSMSFLASLFFYPYNIGFYFLTWIANWFQLVCYNFPFAFFIQIFLVQPFMRQLFKMIFGSMEEEDNKKKKEMNNMRDMEMAVKMNENSIKHYDTTNALQLIEQLKKEIMDCGNSTLVDESLEEQEIVEVRID